VSPSTSTSVLGVKLAHTGSDDVSGALVLSLALLGLGAILVVSAQTVPAAARRRH
jgi:LPXTG-motif cell wall-anchored protein